MEYYGVLHVNVLREKKVPRIFYITFINSLLLLSVQYCTYVLYCTYPDGSLWSPVGLELAARLVEGPQGPRRWVGRVGGQRGHH